MRKSTAILIPARLKSTRFPGKMLADLNGKSLVRRVFDICSSTGIDTYVLSDSEEVLEQIPFENRYLSRMDHDNGTSRCSEAAMDLDYAYFVNVQGDMPDITAEIIDAVLGRLIGDTTSAVVTAYTEMEERLRHDPNAVKMIHTNGSVHWFCRASLPYGDHHLGIYGYCKHALLSYPDLPRHSTEDIEKLEQLRWLSNGWRLNAVPVSFSGIEINSPEDLQRWRLTIGLNVV
jgi:3-deoxy-D-manno-octulosonate cytidylyltransferase